jgi:hypothetical protein
MTLTQTIRPVGCRRLQPPVMSCVPSHGLWWFREAAVVGGTGRGGGGGGHIMPSDRLRPGVALLFQCFPVKSFCHLLRLQFDTHLQQRFIQSLAQQHQCCIVFVFFFFLLHSRFVERSVFVSLLGNNLEIQKSAIPLPLSFAPAAFDQVFCC